MDRQTFEALDASSSEPIVLAAALLGPDRTLLYGFDGDGDIWHIYLLDGHIHREVLARSDRATLGHEARTRWLATELIPAGRVYPEDADERFVRIVRGHGVEIGFGDFDDDRHLFVQRPFTVSPTAR